MIESHQCHQCSETLLTEPGFIVSVGASMGHKPLPPWASSKQFTHWTSETVYQSEATRPHSAVLQTLICHVCSSLPQLLYFVTPREIYTYLLTYLCISCCPPVQHYSVLPSNSLLFSLPRFYSNVLLFNILCLTYVQSSAVFFSKFCYIPGSIFYRRPVQNVVVCNILPSQVKCFHILLPKVQQFTHSVVHPKTSVPGPVRTFRQQPLPILSSSFSPVLCHPFAKYPANLFLATSILLSNIPASPYPVLANSSPASLAEKSRRKS